MSAPEIFDRRAVRLHRDRAAATVARVAPVLEDCAERLLDRFHGEWNGDVSRIYTEASF